MSFFHHLQPYVNSMVPQCSPGLMGRAFPVLFTELGHLSEVLVCVGHLAASPTLAGLRLCPLNLQAWKRPLSTTGVYVWSIGPPPLAPAHCSVLDSIFFPLEFGFIFFLLNLTMCLKFFYSLCVCFYR